MYAIISLLNQRTFSHPPLDSSFEINATINPKTVQLKGRVGCEDREGEQRSWVTDRDSEVIMESMEMFNMVINLKK